MAKARQFLTDTERQAMWQKMRLKGELKNLKESRMPLKALKKKIGKELYQVDKADFEDIMLRHDFHVETDLMQHIVVYRIYEAKACGWPKHSKYDWGDETKTEYTIQGSSSVPLVNYWRLALQGKGL